ncbi:MAG: HU family DNA-binding protein [Lachnospirales bacterium]
MNKTEFVSAIAGKTELTKKDVEKVLKSFEEVITEELADKGEIRLVGFGTFGVAERPERVGRNPKTNEPITIPASIKPRFKAGKVLKDAINKR